MTSALNIVGDLPEIEELSVEGICRSVFERILQSDHIIDDLSLPERSNLNPNFEMTLSIVRFDFELHPEQPCLPTSTTKTQFDDGAIRTVVHINYTTHEAEAMPNIVKAKILREATHAIRYAMVHFANKTGVPTRRMLSSTPSKEKKAFQYDQVRESAIPLYKMEYSNFQAGHYMEHVMLGGVWTKLCEFTCSETGEVTRLPAGGIAFKIVRKVGERNIMMDSWGVLTFNEFEGFDVNETPARILHCSLLRVCDRSI